MIVMEPVIMKVITSPPKILNQSSIERLESLGIVGNIDFPEERNVVVGSVMQCSVCGGTVDKYEHVFQCRDCFAMEDSMTGIMSPCVEKEVLKK